MKKPTLFGFSLVGLVACAAAGCAGSGSSGTDASAAASKNCNAATNAPVSNDGGLIQIGSSDQSTSIMLQEGGFYAMPSGKYQGYCFTYDDKSGSTLYPPCGTTGPCFTQATGLCLSANLGAGSVATWGGGFGCNLSQPSGTSTALYTDITGKTSLTVGVTGCKIPDQLQMQLNVANPPATPAGIPGSGYFCKRANLSPPDANGMRSVTIQLTELTEDCWLDGGPKLDPATMYVVSVQGQINAIESTPSNWDFCVSQLSIQ
jgi:hypothetical protein